MLTVRVVALWACLSLAAVGVLAAAGMLGEYVGAGWYKLVLVLVFCGLLALCVALQTAYRSRRFCGRIFETDDGFELDAAGAEPRPVAWERIERLTAWEVPGWQRVLYLAFEQAGEDEPVEVHDRDAGFGWLAEQLPARLAGVGKDWPGTVHTGAGPLVLYGAPLSDDEEDDEEDDEDEDVARERLYGTQ